MKKRFSKKLVLGKETVAMLSDKNMDKIRGGTLFYDCTESCTLFYYCCDTKTKPLAENRAQAEG